MRAVEAVRAAIRAGCPGVLGIHLEGPFLSVARKGAHDPALIRPLTDRDVDALLDTGIADCAVDGRGRERLAGTDPAPDGRRRHRQHRPQRRVLRGGLRGGRCRRALCITHLFNAMSPLGHRAPGVVGAALDHPGLWGGLIADGHHVHPAALRTALRAKRGPGRLFLVSDAMPPAGSPGDRFTLSGRERQAPWRCPHVRRRHAGRRGSHPRRRRPIQRRVTSTSRSARCCAWRASIPAQMLRIDDARGRLAPGFQADMVLLGDDLRVRRVWIGGV